MDPDVLRLAQLLAIIGIFAIAATVFVVVLKIVVARIKHHSLPPASQSMRVDDSRFERLEQAVDAIAIEVERMSEAQRFTAKLMTERAPEQLPATPREKGTKLDAP
jgi:hypothetical protein